MIHIIMGLRGTGKTKKLIDSINTTLQSATGDVTCIEYGKKLTYDISHKARLVDSKEYGINSAEMLKGFLSGLHAGNFDITHVYIDNLYKTIGHDLSAAEDFVVWADKFASTNDMDITISISEDPALVSERMRSYLL